MRTCPSCSQNCSQGDVCPLRADKGLLRPSEALGVILAVLLPWVILLIVVALWRAWPW